MADEVVLVDENDAEIGTCEKVAAHQPPGHLHRALSTFVLCDGAGIVLQRRALEKYHFPGRWSNSCCTHPRPGETILEAGERRLREELGLDCRLRDLGTFTYRATDPTSGLVEHELDHVLVGHSSAAPKPNRSEVAATMVMELDDLQASLERHPERYTPWLGQAVLVLRRGLQPELIRHPDVDPARLPAHERHG